jgi:hypothetical protein
MNDNAGSSSKCFFAIGGGSDFFSACLLSRSDDDMILTALGPQYQDNSIDLPKTLQKYLSGAYPFLRMEGSSWPVFLDTRRPLAFGVLVPNKANPSYNECCLAVKKLVASREIEAVDTGGDSLRGLLPGFGDIDVSSLFGGCKDTRDEDCIALIHSITRKPVRLVILGPGSDGETSEEGLKQGINALANRPEGGRIRLVSKGCMSTLLSSKERNIGWIEPSPGSTIYNITRALDLGGNSSRIPIVRRGNVLHEIPVHSLTSFLIVEIHSIR